MCMTLFRMRGNRNSWRNLQPKFNNIQWSFNMGGDFNLIRFSSEKSSESVDQSKMDMFNNFISETGIKEMTRKGSKFTWTNKQDNPIMCILGRVFTSFDWDFHYPWSTYEVPTRVGSNHNPLLVTTEDVRVSHPYFFRFEMAWFTHPEFQEKLLAR